MGLITLRPVVQIHLPLFSANVTMSEASGPFDGIARSGLNQGEKRAVASGTTVVQIHLPLLVLSRLQVNSGEQ